MQGYEIKFTSPIKATTIDTIKADKAALLACLRNLLDSNLDNEADAWAEARALVDRLTLER